MRKRKGRTEISETLIGQEDGGDEISEKEVKGFFACYLLTSLSPRHKGHTYIGFTVNPRRRIRQHNGEIRSGAWRTKGKRPWEMVLCIYGFPTNVSALQFEWAWQHPKESLAVRKAAASLKSLSGLANKIKLVYTMLTLPAWQSLNLTVNFFSTKYTKHSAGCPSLPEQMKVQVCPMEELPCYMEGDNCLYENEDDRDNEEECDEAFSTDGSMKEGLTDDQNSIEMPTREQFGWVEENDDTRQSRDSPTPKDLRQPCCLSNSPATPKDLRQPCCLSNSPVRTLNSLAKLLNTKGGTVEDRDTFGLIEDGGGIELCRLTRKQLPAIVAEDKDQPPMGQLTRKQLPLPAIVAEDKDQPPISLTVSKEVEVIDVLTPSPDCRISSCRKKRRRAAKVRSEIIDLTKSPLFVQL